MAEPELIVVGLAGRMRAGKDTAASGLALAGFRRVALADGVKSALHDLGGGTGEIYKALDAAGRGVRWGWQTLGSEARELAGCPHLWCDLLAAKVAFAARLLPGGGGRFVVPDVRMPHEPDQLRAAVTRLGGSYETWRVRRPSLPPVPRDAHASELFADDLPAALTLVNDGTPEDLVRRAHAAAVLRFGAAS